MKKTLVILITTAIVAISIIGYIFIFNRPNRNNVVKTPTPIELPRTIFDGAMQIPQTYITFTYPIDGFYGKGIRQIPYNMFNNLYDVVGGIGLEPSSKINTDNASEHISLTIDARKAKKTKSLNELITSLKDDRSAERRPDGSVQIIGNVEYYIAKSTSEDVVIYDAYTQIGLNYVHVGFQFSTAPGETNRLATENNEKLFYEYLQNINIREM